MLIVIVIILSIGRYYLKLARKFEKNLFQFPLLGIATFIGGSYFFYWFLTFCFYLFNNPSFNLNGIEGMEITFISILLSFIATIVLYFVLKSKWKKERNQFKETELLDN